MYYSESTNFTNTSYFFKNEIARIFWTGFRNFYAYYVSCVWGTEKYYPKTYHNLGRVIRTSQI